MKFHGSPPWGPFLYGGLWVSFLVCATPGAAWARASPTATTTSAVEMAERLRCVMACLLGMPGAGEDVLQHRAARPMPVRRVGAQRRPGRGLAGVGDVVVVQ